MSLECVCSVCPDPAPQLPVVKVKDEPNSRAGSEHGEEEMEVDSVDELAEAPRSQSHGQALSQASKANPVAGSFNTLSSLSTLRPGKTCKHEPITFMSLSCQQGCLFHRTQNIHANCTV